MLVGLRIYPLTSKPENFLTITQKKQGLPTDPDFVRYIEEWAKSTFIVPPRIDKYFEINNETISNQVLQKVRIELKFIATNFQNTSSLSKFGQGFSSLKTLNSISKLSFR